MGNTAIAETSAFSPTEAPADPGTPVRATRADRGRSAGDGRLGPHDRGAREFATTERRPARGEGDVRTTGLADEEDRERNRRRVEGRIGKKSIANLPDYRDFEEIGRDGMGMAYKARHIRLDRAVALKVVRAGRRLARAPRPVPDRGAGRR